MNAIQGRLAELAFLKGGWPEVYQMVRGELAQRRTIAAAELDALVFEEVKKLGAGGAPRETGAASAIIRANPFTWQDPQTIKRREWLYDRHFIRGFLSTTIAPGGVGKSALLTAEIASSGEIRVRRDALVGHEKVARAGSARRLRRRPSRRGRDAELYTALDFVTTL